MLPVKNFTSTLPLSQSTLNFIFESKNDGFRPRSGFFLGFYTSSVRKSCSFGPDRGGFWNSEPRHQELKSKTWPHQLRNLYQIN